MAGISEYIDMLMEAKRRAQLAGMQFRPAEESAIAKGYFADKASQNMNELSLEEQKRQYDASLALQREKFTAEKDAAERARKRDRWNTALKAGSLLGSLYQTRY
jgi:hypothetical protein